MDEQEKIEKKVDWPHEKPAARCAENVCTNGHAWVPTVQLAKCPGCGGPVLMVKRENCPFCNEPVKSFRLRTDHIGYQQGFGPVCQGWKSPAEVVMVEMEREQVEVGSGS